MGDISKNFNRKEFACKCGCGQDNISLAVVDVWQDVRDHFNASVHITSGSRCEKHNKAVGGVKHSSHTTGEDGLSHAADGQVEGVEPARVADYIESKYPNSLGMGRYKVFTHVDDRSDRAYRWGEN